tara:strand:+ start:50 stop:238 length:189 start_codon:yes stop_codon:yes gene_type:complete
LSIRIVADCVALSCQVTRKLERAKALEFTAISAIMPFFILFPVNIAFLFLFFCPFLVISGVL